MAALSALVCAHLAAEPNKKQACEKTHEAISLAYKVDKQFHILAKEVEHEAREIIGDTAAGGVVAIYTVAIKQEARFATGDIPLVQTTVLKIKKDSTSIQLLWDF